MKWGVRRLSGAALLILASTWAAAAADMAVKAPPPLPAATAPSPAWTGFYAGLNLGYGFGDDPTTESTVSAAGFPIIGAGTPLYKSPADFNIHPEGIIGGGQIGYNFQVAPTWIGGIEADFQGTGMTDNLSCVYSCGTPIVSAAVFPGFPTIFSEDSYEARINWFGTVRARFGYTDGPDLIYATGGLAYGEVEQSGAVAGITTPGVINRFAGSFDTTSTHAGWTVGAGWERMLWGTWSVKAEYLYIDLGRATDTFSTFYLPGSIIGTPGTAAATRTDTTDFHENIVRVGLNYKFK